MGCLLHVLKIYINKIFVLSLSLGLGMIKTRLNGGTVCLQDGRKAETNLHNFWHTATSFCSEHVLTPY